MRNQKTKHVRDGAAPDQPISNLLLEALETEIGGLDVYKTALECVVNDDLRNEWEKYLSETEEHVAALTEVCTAFGLDPSMDTPGRQIVRHIGKSLVKAMQLALGSGSRQAAELVAAECVVHAETKDHGNWQLMQKVSENLRGRGGDAMRAACEKFEDQEDEHLYHNQGWCRELAKAAQGLPATLPPPEEEQDVHSAMEAARAKASPKK